MSDNQQSLNISTSLINNEIRTPKNKIFEFLVNVQNLIGEKVNQPIYIALFVPREVQIVTDKKRSIGSIPPRGVKQCVFKIKGKKEGIFDLRLEVTKKNTLLTNLPLKMYIGQQQIYKPFKQPIVQEQTGVQQQQAIQQETQPITIPEKALTKKCPFCEELIEENSVFCPICGVELEDRK